MENTRELARQVEGRSFTFSAGTIAASAKKTFDLTDHAQYSKMVPFDGFHIFNNSNSVIEIRPNQDDLLMVPIAGKMEKGRGDLHIWNLSITEISGSEITAGDVQITIIRLSASADTMWKRIAKRIFDLSR